MISKFLAHQIEWRVEQEECSGKKTEHVDLDIWSLQWLQDTLRKYKGVTRGIHSSKRRIVDKLHRDGRWSSRWDSVGQEFGRRSGLCLTFKGQPACRGWDERKMNPKRSPKKGVAREIRGKLWLCGATETKSTKNWSVPHWDILPKAKVEEVWKQLLFPGCVDHWLCLLEKLRRRDGNGEHTPKTFSCEERKDKGWGVRWMVFPLRSTALLQLWHSTSIFPASQKAHGHKPQVIIVLGLSSQQPPQVKQKWLYCLCQNISGNKAPGRPWPTLRKLFGRVPRMGRKHFTANILLTKSLPWVTSQYEQMFLVMQSHSQATNSLFYRTSDGDRFVSLNTSFH